MNITEELKKLDQEAKRIAKRKQALEAKAKARAEHDQKLEKLLKDSGLKTPRALIKALMEKYGIRSVSLTKANSAAAPAEPGEKKKRTRVTMTAKLRDEIKKSLKTETTYGAIAKAFGVSYPVVKNVEAGGYDKLK